MVHQTCLELKPVEGGNIVIGLYELVCKVRHIYLFPTIFFLKLFSHTSIRNTVAITQKKFSETISFGIISHTQGDGVIKLF